ncbi:MAG: N-acetylmuramic acid 6-phosphate etherase [Anaerolineae bacterium]|nr:N-acetylmuramic acid 6-phosphate etherase [Anaerolineae bacterium]
MNNPLVIGINGGGTHTSLALVDANLNILARSEAGPTNVNYIGIDAARRSLEDGLRELATHVPLSQITAIGAGIAGVDRPSDHERMQEVFAQLCPGTPVTLDNDAVPALIAGVGQRFGIVTICGTGMISLGLNAAGDRARSGGWGDYPDHGSGYAIARDMLYALVQAHDQSGAPTALTERILTKLGLQSTPDLISWLYTEDRRVDKIASLAAEVIRAANDHDLVAIRILTRAARALANETVTVARKLGLDSPDVERVPILMSGGLFMHSAVLRDVFTITVQTSVPAAATLTTDREAALGSAMMALEALGVALPQPDYATNAETSRRMTERRNPLTMDIHHRPTLELVTMMNLEDEFLWQAIEKQLPQIAALIDAIAERFDQGGRLLMLGAGTSGRLAVLDAAECRPTFSISPDRVIGLLAGGESAMFRSLEGAEDDADMGRQAILDRNVGALDSVIGVAASGSTPFVRGALEAAAAHGALSASITNVVNAPISALVQHPIVLATGPEALTGSTRLKAGSAQKMTLNMITTGVMVRVGRTFGNLMTDVQTSNNKLRHRAIVIVADATGLDHAAAADILARCSGDIKTAIVAALLNVAPEDASAQLAAAHGNIGKVIQ